jgi:hypothetical protein
MGWRAEWEAGHDGGDAGVRRRPRAFGGRRQRAGLGIYFSGMNL